MTRLVMDVIFLETLEFKMPTEEFRVCTVAPSREEILRQCLASKGIELIDYGTWLFQPSFGSHTVIKVFSTAYRERAERATASR